MSTPNKTLAQTVRVILSRGVPRTLEMNGNYDYFYTPNDPDELFDKAKDFQGMIQAAILTSTLTEAQVKAYDEVMTQAFIDFVSGSNQIERAGLNQEITTRICRAMFEGDEDIHSEELELRIDEYEDALQQFGSDGKVGYAHREVVQHGQALNYLVSQVIEENKALSEDILLEAHRILCDGIPSHDGVQSSIYAGKYRTENVTAGFSAFTPTAQVPAAMRSMFLEFVKDMNVAESSGVMDPFFLASKYCHKFVNIHPFLDGNGRTCRLLLNCILLKYAGIVITIGGSEEERDEYLEIASRGSMAEQVEEDERSKPAWAELASYVVEKGAEKLEDFPMALKEDSLAEDMGELKVGE